jgi:hypothetical protein
VRPTRVRSRSVADNPASDDDLSVADHNPDAVHDADALGDDADSHYSAADAHHQPAAAAPALPDRLAR